MPLNMCIHPIGLAALAIVAIGLISYNIIKNKKRKIPVRERRNEYEEVYKTELKSYDDYEIRRRRNATTEIKTPGSEKTSPKSRNKSSEDFKNNYDIYSNRTSPDFSCGSAVQKEGFSNNFNSLNQNIGENSKSLNIIENINQEDSEKLDITKIVIDEDAQSSVSNASVTNANDFTGETTSLEYKKSEDNSEVNISEKLYKKEVCEYLRNEVETLPLCSDVDSDLSENEDDMSILRDLDDTVDKPIICRGCEESYANAVAYPCRHRYLCLDCAIKVHRIYQKCTVCNFHIETYDIFDTQNI